MKINDILNMLLEYETKHGDEITFKRIEDSEGDNNRGWQVDEIRAYVNDKEAGYIKISYIPHTRMKKHMPTIYNWMAQIGGKHYMPLDKRHYHYKDLTPEERRKMLKYVVYTKFVPWGKETEFVDALNDKEVLEKLREFEEKLNSDIEGKRFREFKNYHKDKPIVDYIRVEDDFKRQRIGEALYLEGSKWMKEKGMKLYASGVQTDAAKNVWGHLSKKYNVTNSKNRKRKYLEV